MLQPYKAKYNRRPFEETVFCSPSGTCSRHQRRSQNFRTCALRKINWSIQQLFSWILARTSWYATLKQANIEGLWLFFEDFISVHNLWGENRLVTHVGVPGSWIQHESTGRACNHDDMMVILQCHRINIHLQWNESDTCNISEVSIEMHENGPLQFSTNIKVLVMNKACIAPPLHCACGVCSMLVAIFWWLVWGSLIPLLKTFHFAPTLPLPCFIGKCSRYEPKIRARDKDLGALRVGIPRVHQGDVDVLDMKNSPSNDLF